MKINELSLVTEISAGDFGREVKAHVAAVPGILTGMLGSQKGAENATERIARGKFVNTFTNKFLANLNADFSKKKTDANNQAQSTQQPQKGIPMAAEIKQMVQNYANGYSLTEPSADTAINDFCTNIENAYNQNGNPADELRKLGDFLFSIIRIQQKSRQPAQNDNQNSQNQPQQAIDAQAKEAINVIKNLNAKNNTQQVAISALEQLRKTNPQAYSALIASLK